jgi:hypothetical protein
MGWPRISSILSLMLYSITNLNKILIITIGKGKVSTESILTPAGGAVLLLIPVSKPLQILRSARPVFTIPNLPNQSPTKY